MDILTEARKFLEGIGIIVDAESLAFAKASVTEYITNFCNTKEVPIELFYAAVRRVCAAYLGRMAALGKLDPGSFPIEQAVKAITEGDVSISFSEGVSERDLLMQFIAELSGSDGELISHRSLTW